MSSTKHRLTTARTLGVAIAGALSLAACVTRDDIAAINSRLDHLDTQVQSTARSAQSANEAAERANQRLDQMEGRIQRLETQPAPAPRRRRALVTSSTIPYERFESGTWRPLTC